MLTPSLFSYNLVPPRIKLKRRLCRHDYDGNNVGKRTCWRCCRVSWSLISCNWWIIAFSRMCLSSIVGADPITNRILSMTSPFTWRHPTSGADRSSPFPFPLTCSEYPLTSGLCATSDSDTSRRWLGERRAGTALRFLADILSGFSLDLWSVWQRTSWHTERSLLLYNKNNWIHFTAIRFAHWKHTFIS